MGGRSSSGGGGGGHAVPGEIRNLWVTVAELHCHSKHEVRSSRSGRLSAKHFKSLVHVHTFPSTLPASVHKPPHPHHHHHHQSPNSPAAARSQSEKEEGVPSRTDVEIAAAHRGIIMLSVSPFECLRDAAQWQWEDLGERENFSPLCWCFFNNQPSSWRRKWTPNAGISWSRCSCLVRVTGHPVSSLSSDLFQMLISTLSSLLFARYSV